MLKVIVDRDVCQADRRCTFTAPQVLFDQEGEFVVGRDEAGGSLRDEAGEAADVCAVQAITIEI
ncbi:MAG TPA: ferredoxin [Kineosporiaceae bacterium]|nr:ferredoxin [Kineosporiaceae bacterium]